MKKTLLSVYLCTNIARRLSISATAIDSRAVMSRVPRPVEDDDVAGPNPCGGRLRVGQSKAAQFTQCYSHTNFGPYSFWQQFSNCNCSSSSNSSSSMTLAHVSFRCSIWSLSTMLLMILILLVTSANCIRVPLPQSSTAVQGTSATPLLQDVFNFWLQHGLDRQYGGFHGALDRQGQPMDPTSKGTVQQARHLWAFSTLLMAPHATWGFRTMDVREAADSAYTFMRNNMMRDVDGGRLFVYETSTESAVTNASVNVYSNAFAVYGLAAYARATRDPSAKALALDTYETLDRLLNSPATGAYDESTADFALHSIALPGSNTACSSSNSSSANAGAACSMNGPPRLSQSLNTLLHMTEALTELSRLVMGSNPTVTARLLELVQLMSGPLVVRTSKTGPNTPSAYLAPNYDSTNWSPINIGNPGLSPGPWLLGSYIAFGHNLEAAYLLADAVAELQARVALDSSQADVMLGVCQEMGKAAVSAGFDTEHGGFFDGSILGASTPTSPYKIWWTQAEGLAGLVWLHNRTGNATYNHMLQQAIQFVQDNLQDEEFGEWYWQTGPAGGDPLSYPRPGGGGDFAATVKRNAWKASYHTGRASMRLVQAGY